MILTNTKATGGENNKYNSHSSLWTKLLRIWSLWSSFKRKTHHETSTSNLKKHSEPHYNSGRPPYVSTTSNLVHSMNKTYRPSKKQHHYLLLLSTNTPSPAKAQAPKHETGPKHKKTPLESRRRWPKANKNLQTSKQKMRAGETPS